MKIFPGPIVAAAALDAMRPDAIGFGAQLSVRRRRKLACVKQRVIAKAERRPQNSISAKTASAADDAALVSGRAA